MLLVLLQWLALLQQWGELGCWKALAWAAQQANCPDRWCIQ
jgi:hypothetical protein